jgi:hypothetical protein
MYKFRAHKRTPEGPGAVQPPSAIGKGAMRTWFAVRQGAVSRIPAFEASLPLPLVPVFALVS